MLRGAVVESDGSCMFIYLFLIAKLFSGLVVPFWVSMTNVMRFSFSTSSSVLELSFLFKFNYLKNLF